MPNPLILPCLTPPAACFPCFVSPLANTSQEGPDGQVFLGISFDSQQPPILPNLTNQTWQDYGCQTLCTSTVSQEDATQCADRANSLCFQTGPPNDDGPPGPQMFLNNRQTCASFCPDGLPFIWVVPAGTFSAITQILADRMAVTWACYKARAHRICLSALNPSSGKIANPYTGTITILGGVDPPQFNFWSLTSGSLPPGLQFNGGFHATGVTITGLPTQAGTFQFSVTVTTLSGDFMQKQYTLTIAAATMSAYWAFEETSGNYIDNVANFGMQPLFLPPDTVPGKINNATRISEAPGRNSQLQLGGPNWVKANALGLTIWGWIKYSVVALDNPTFNLIMPVNAFGINNGFNFTASTVDNINVNWLGQFLPSNQQVTANSGLIGQWNFFVITWDKAAQSLKIYINAVLQATLNGCTGPANDFTPGFWDYSFGSPFLQGDNSLLDEFGIIFGPGLSQGQVNALFNGGNGVTWPSVASIVNFT